ncbi:hypothetical protein BJ170DRAFT_710639 [Xylariales sp. AK1849]|nr:hypothetical protein BJ170DRAFT_710639 [Xylariales sp. AK1849]
MTMLAPTLLSIACFGLLVLAGEHYALEQYAPISTAHIHNRQLATCNQTYGAGSELCGGADSTFCYNPTVGQTCCTGDRGFCGKGSYCAPVDGYCCFEGEDLTSCAQDAGFTLPAGLVTSGSTANAAPTKVNTGVAPTDVASTNIGIVTPFLPSPTNASATTHTTSTPNTTCVDIITQTPSYMNIVITPAPAPVSNTTIPPYVQAAFAVRVDQVVIGSLATVGLAVILATFF